MIDWLTWLIKTDYSNIFNTQNPTQIPKIKNVWVVAWIMAIETQRHKTPCETNK